ncbi:MAG: glycosyltransferase family 1 protein [Candidatus Sumerlaeia bacterium]|nr:glycosyltransferase family 1 protein [Candidatus Sumerlaeia bacterium]
MKIGVCTFGGDGGKSGISRYIMSLLREFARDTRGHRIEVLAYADERSVFLPPEGALDAIEFPGSLRPPVRNIWWHQASLPGLCRERGYDVFFLPAANRRTSLRLPCPSVGTVHDFSSLHVGGKYDPARMFYIRQVLPFLIRRLGHILTVSESSKRDIVAYAGIPAERVTVTPLAADHALYHPGDGDAARASIREKYRIEPPFILYTSRLEHPGKNHVRLIEAFDRVKSARGVPHRLVLAGSDWSGSDAVRAAAAKAKHGADIVLPGFVAGADLPDFYRACDAFIFPSLYEGFGLPIIEAMACGVPVACSNVSSMPEVAGDAAPTFDPSSVESIAGALERLLLDAELRAACRVRCPERARGFNWSATAAATLDVLEATAGGGRR